MSFVRDVANAPVASRHPHPTTVHGDTREDDYFWLRDRDDPAVTAYLEAENVYADEILAPAAGLRETLYDEMLSHIKQTDLSVPYRLGAYAYYSRTEAGKQYPILARRRASADDASEAVVLDLNALAEGHPYLGLGAYEVSDDGHLLAYTIDTTGYRQYTLHVKDLRTGALSSEAIPRVGSVVWAADNATLFYTTEDEVSKREDRFWRHALGSDDSTLVYDERDERFHIGAGRTNDRAFVLLGAFSKATTEWRALRADRPLDDPTTIVAREDDHRYTVEHHGTSFYLVTNRGAVENRIVRVPDDGSVANERDWVEVVPERPDVHVDEFDVFARYAVVRGRSDGFANIEIFDFATGTLRDVPMPEVVHDIDHQPNPEFDTDSYRFAYTSLVAPRSIYELDLRANDRTLLKETEVPGYDRARYATELRYATARDGTRVPISIVSRADVPRDGTAALLLYGYGSYGISMDPAFSPARLALLDRNVIYAIAHIRGGGELGERWRTAGHLQHKMTTFEDFIDCAEFLIAERYTTPARLAIQGGSAGGLLACAVANMRPDLFAAVVAQVPFVDVLNTMLDATLPLTTAEYLEWGDPNVAADYAYMKRYSPYDNVHATAYPAMMVKVSVNDSQVPYWEGAKLVARIREKQSGSRPIVLVTNFGAGHGGASGRYDALREIAQTYAFVLAMTASA